MNWKLLSFTFLISIATGDTSVLEFTSNTYIFDFLPSYFNEEDFTEEIWVYSEVLPDKAMSFLRQDLVYEITMDEDNYFGFSYFLEDETTNDEVTNNRLTVDVWTHLALTYSKDSSELIFYKDSSEAVRINPEFVFYPGTKYIIYRPSGSTGSTWGEIALRNYRYWSTTMTQTEISYIKLMNTYPSPKRPYLISFYQLTDAASEKTFFDYGPYHNHISFYHEEKLGTVSMDRATLSDPVSTYSTHEFLNMNSEHLDIFIPEDAHIGDEWTLEFWVYFVDDSTSAIQKFITQPDCQNGVYIDVKYSSDNYFSWFPQYPDKTNEIRAPYQSADGSWAFFIFENDRANFEARIRYSNEGFSTNIDSPSTISLEGGANFCINTKIVIAEDEDLNFKFSDFKMWSSIRSTLEIEKTSKTRRYSWEMPDLVFYYPFTDLTDVNFIDETKITYPLNQLPSSSYETAANNWDFGYMSHNTGNIKMKVRRLHVSYGNCRINLANTNFPNVLESETVSFWVKITSYNGDSNRAILYRENDFYVYSNKYYTRYYVVMYAATGSASESYGNNNIMNYDSWEFMAFSRNLVPFKNNVILGNSYENSVNSPFTSLYDYTTNPIQIGTATGHSSYEFNIHTITLYNEYKSLDDLKRMKFMFPSNGDKSLVSLFRFDEPRSGEDYVVDEVLGIQQSVYASSNCELTSSEYFMQANFKNSENLLYSVYPGSLLMKSETDDLLELDFTSSFRLLQDDFTLQNIFKITGTPSESSPVKLFFNEALFDIGINSALKMYVKLGAEEFICSFTVPSNKFIYFTITKSSTTVNLYFNSTLKESFALNSAFGFATPLTQTIKIQTGGTKLWLREIRVWSRVLSYSHIVEGAFTALHPKEHQESLRLYYKLDESMGTTVRDYSSRKDESHLSERTSSIDIKGITWDIANPIRICNTNERYVDRQCIVKNRLLQFKSNYYKPISSKNKVELANEYTVEFWAYVDTIDEFNTYLFEKESHIAIKIVKGSDYDVEFNGNDGSATRNDVTELSQTVTPVQEWHYFSIGNSRLLDISLLGVDSTFTTESAFELADQDNYKSKVYVGGNSDQKTDETFNGYMKELRIWNTFKSQGHIMKYAHQTLTGNELHLVGYWKMVDATGNYIQDYSSLDNYLVRPENSYPPWIRYRSLTNPKVCGPEEFYDFRSSYDICTYKLLRAFTPSATATIQLPVDFGSEAPDDFAIQYWMYIDTITTHFTLEWPNRFLITISNDKTTTMTIEGSSNHNLELSYIVYDTWVQVGFSFSLSEGTSNLYIYNYGASSLVKTTTEESITHAYSSAPSSYLEIDTSGYTGYLKEMRLWGSYISDFSTFAYPFNVLVDPSEDSNLISYWRLDEGYQTKVYDLAKLGTIYEGGSFSWTIDDNADNPILCKIELSQSSPGFCVKEDLQIKYTNNEFSTICSPNCLCYLDDRSYCPGNMEGTMINSHYKTTFTLQNANDNPQLEWTFDPPLSDTSLLTQESNYIILAADALALGTEYTLTLTKTSNSMSRKLRIYSVDDLDDSSASLSVSPSKGDASEQYTITASGFVDSESPDLYYQFSYYRNGDSSVVYEIGDKSTSNTISTTLPSGDEKYEYKIVIKVNVISTYGATSEKSTLVAVEPIQTQNPTKYFQEQLTIAKTQGTSAVLQVINSAHVFIINEESSIYTNSLTPCGYCYNQGVCDEKTLECQCPYRYQTAKDCSISDREATKQLSLKDQLMQELEDMGSSDIESIMDAQTSSNMYISSIQTLVQNQNVHSQGLNVKALNSLQYLIEEQELRLQKSLSQVSTHTGLSEASVKNAFSAIGSIMKGIKKYTLDDDISAKKAKIPDMVKILTLQQSQYLEVSDSTTTKTVSFQTKVTSKTASDYAGLELTDGSATITFPATSVLSSSTQTQVFPTSVMTWYSDPFEATIPLQNYKLFSNYTSVSIINQDYFGEQHITGITDGIQIQMQTPNDFYGKTLKCAYYDHGTLSTAGMTLEAQTYSGGNSVVTCKSTHLSNFVVIGEDTAIITKSEDDNKVTAMFYYNFFISLGLEALFIWFLILDIRKRKSKVNAQDKDNKEEGQPDPDEVTPYGDESPIHFLNQKQVRSEESSSSMSEEEKIKELRKLQTLQQDAHGIIENFKNVFKMFMKENIQSARTPRKTKSGQMLKKKKKRSKNAKSTNQMNEIIKIERKKFKEDDQISEIDLEKRQDESMVGENNMNVTKDQFLFINDGNDNSPKMTPSQAKKSDTTLIPFKNKFSYLQLYLSCQNIISWVFSYPCQLERSERVLTLFLSHSLRILFVGIFLNSSILILPEGYEFMDYLIIFLFSLISAAVFTILLQQPLRKNLNKRLQLQEKNLLQYIFGTSFVLLLILGSFVAAMVFAFDYEDSKSKSWVVIVLIINGFWIIMDQLKFVFLALYSRSHYFKFCPSIYFMSPGIVYA